MWERESKKKKKKKQTKIENEIEFVKYPTLCRLAFYLSLKNVVIQIVWATLVSHHQLFIVLLPTSFQPRRKIKAPTLVRLVYIDIPIECYWSFQRKNNCELGSIEIKNSLRTCVYPSDQVWIKYFNCARHKLGSERRKGDPHGNYQQFKFSFVATENLNKIIFLAREKKNYNEISM